VGHYESDTLVIDTMGIKVGPFAMLDWYGTPHTEALHVVERYRLINYEAAKESEERGAREDLYLPASATGLVRNPDDKGKGLQLEFTVEDEGVFTMPWTAIITYRRPLGEWPEVVCAENPHEYYAGKTRRSRLRVVQISECLSEEYADSRSVLLQCKTNFRSGSF
jgi:hypothetical protein